MPKVVAQGKTFECDRGNNLRQVLGDVKVTKFDGFWGQGAQSVWTAEQ